MYELWRHHCGMNKKYSDHKTINTRKVVGKLRLLFINIRFTFYYKYIRVLHCVIVCMKLSHKLHLYILGMRLFSHHFECLCVIMTEPLDLIDGTCSVCCVQNDAEPQQVICTPIQFYAADIPDDTAKMTVFTTSTIDDGHTSTVYFFIPFASSFSERDRALEDVSSSEWFSRVWENCCARFLSGTTPVVKWSHDALRLCWNIDFGRWFGFTASVRRQDHRATFLWWCCRQLGV